MTAFGDYVQIMLTERCNLRCTHCAVPEEDSPAQSELGTSEWTAFVSALAGWGAKSLTISGGEATLRRDVLEILERSLAEGFDRVTLLTNGLVRDETLRRLATLQESYPALGVHVSLDGASAGTHELIRGRGTFRATLSRLARFAELGGRLTGVHTVLHQANVHEFDAVVALVRHLGADVWTVFPVAALGRASRSTLTPLSPEQWAKVTRRIAAVRVADGLDVGQMGPVVGDEWPADGATLPKGREPISRNIVVGPDGAMFLCPPLREHLIGDARATGSDPAMLDEARALGEQLTSEICPDCKFRLLCTGIDPGRPFVPSPPIPRPAHDPARLMSSGGLRAHLD